MEKRKKKYPAVSGKNEGCRQEIRGGLYEV